jgi:TonB family protein
MLSIRNDMTKKIFIFIFFSISCANLFAQALPPKVLVKPAGVPTYEPYQSPASATNTPKATPKPTASKPVVKTVAKAETDSIFAVVDTPAKYKLPLDQMYTQIIADMDYPTLARRNKIKGAVLMSFEVTKEGIAQNVKFEQKSNAEELDNQAFRALENFLKNNSNNWTAATSKGKAVNSSYKIDFSFLTEKRK